MAVKYNAVGTWTTDNTGDVAVGAAAPVTCPISGNVTVGDPFPVTTGIWRDRHSLRYNNDWWRIGNSEPLPFKWEVLAVTIKEQWGIPLEKARCVMRYICEVKGEELE